MIVRVITLCVVSAILCSALRTQRPEIAAAVSLAAGLAALSMLFAEARVVHDLASLIERVRAVDGEAASAIVKAAGIAILAELGAQICIDSGERALAGRIALASRVAMLGLCVPLLAEIAAQIKGLLD